MRQSAHGIGIVIGLVVASSLLRPDTASGACCIESCGSVPWISCTASDQCTGGVCPGPLGSAIAFDPSATCGEGAFAGCPPDETGQCADGVNNDAWTGDTLTDCADPDCAGDPACRVGAPAAGPVPLLVLALALTAAGVARLRGASGAR